MVLSGQLGLKFYVLYLIIFLLLLLFYYYYFFLTCQICHRETSQDPAPTICTFMSDHSLFSLLQALTLPASHHKGKVLAYRLLCVMVVRRHDIPPSRDMLTNFYRVLHQGLVGQDQVSCVPLHSGYSHTANPSPSIYPSLSFSLSLSVCLCLSVLFCSVHTLLRSH